MRSTSLTPPKSGPRFLCLRISLFLSALIAVPASSQTTKGQQSTTLSYGNSKQKEKQSDADLYLPQIDQVFSNPLVASSIAGGTAALNRSIESLMDSLFYSLIDREFRVPITERSWLSANFERRLFSTSQNAYVVVEQAKLGPHYSRELWNIKGVPIRFGAGSDIDVLDIYLTSDATRVAHQEELPPWQQLANNWLGTLPILTQILPPSFNPNELYDPLRLFSTPFHFPLSAKDIYDMPIGTIRSYAISGGIQFPIALDQIDQGSLMQWIRDRTELNFQLPYSIFMSGEHRINILRRSKHVVWVGLSKVQTKGHSLAGIIGDTLYMLGNSIPGLPWQGIATPLFPINSELSESLVSRFNRLYEFNLTKQGATAAFADAIRGDFTTAEKLAIYGDGGGVHYHFTRSEDATEESVQFSNNLFVLNSKHQQKRTKSEVEVEDSNETYFILEGNQNIADEHWDLLLGQEEILAQNSVIMNVEKTNNPENTYSFVPDKEPLYVTLTMNIRNKLCNVREFKQYIRDLRTFTELDLSEMPEFDDFAEMDLIDYRRSGFMLNPKTQTKHIHPPQQILGNFEAIASINFSTKAIETIANQSSTLKWKAFADAFKLPITWEQATQLNPVDRFAHRLNSYIAYPFRLINISLLELDRFVVVENAVKQLDKINSSRDPLDKLDAFYEFFDSSYPTPIAKALVKLAGQTVLPRQIRFYTSPRSSVEAGVRQRFARLNGQIFSNDDKFPTPHRYRFVKEKLSKFFPSQIQAQKSRARLGNIQLSLIDSKRGIMKLKINAYNMDTTKDGFFYIYLKQAGQLQFGKLVLAERVLKLKPLSKPAAIGNQGSYEVFLTGPKSPFQSFLFKETLNFGGTFHMSISASPDGELWSNETGFDFVFEDGHLKSG